jgi:hypothetical protein
MATKNREMKFLPIALLPLLLCACMSADVRQYGKVDSTQKSITVPPGGDLAADLKDILKQRGWTLVVDRGPDVVRGSGGESVDLKAYNTFKTRYRLLLSYRRFDTCIGHMDGAYHYNLSMIDNKSGEEVMVMGGNACASQIKDKFEGFLTSTN